MVRGVQQRYRRESGMPRFDSPDGRIFVSDTPQTYARGGSVHRRSRWSRTAGRRERTTLGDFISMRQFNSDLEPLLTQICFISRAMGQYCSTDTAATRSVDRSTCSERATLYLGGCEFRRLACEAQRLACFLPPYICWAPVGLLFPTHRSSPCRVGEHLDQIL